MTPADHSNASAHKRRRCSSTAPPGMVPTAVARVGRAVVRLPRRGGRGVLVSGGIVVTAAHCIEWTHHGAMVLGDHFLEQIETTDGRLLGARAAGRGGSR